MKNSIADELFGDERAGSPVYTLADAAALARIAAGIGLVVDDPARAISDVVRSSLALDDPGVAPFRKQSDAAKRHKQQPLETPHALPLLLVLTLAAERMQADGELAAHNYYDRLHHLLGVPDERHSRVAQDYRDHAVELWGSLNAWLEAWEGVRGIPTAYSVGGHEYIGLPLSQAVVRQHDREGLHEFFASEGLSPGMRLSPPDMGIAMDPYAIGNPSPLSSHLRGLWKVPASRERIVDAACLELEAWDGAGHLAIETRHATAVPRLLAFLRTFPRAAVDFSLVLPFRSEGPSVATFSVDEMTVTVPTVIGAGGAARLAGFEGVSANSLVGELLVGVYGDTEGRPFTRRPKRVTPLRWDEMNGAYMETERVELGEDSVVIAKADARQLVEAHLETHARPGWSEVVGLAGMPEGWLIYQRVQVLSAPPDRVVDDLLSLVPRARTSLTLRGGFVLPGLLRKWSSLKPPEIVALAAGASVVTVRVYRGTRIDAGELLLEVTEADELSVVSLHDRFLTDGEYLVAMVVDEASRPTSTALLRLRSARTPQVSVDEVDIRLVYSPASAPNWPLSAGPAKWDRHVNGARVLGLPERAPGELVAMREFLPREKVRAYAQPQRTRIGTAMGEDSCVMTGRHRIKYPTVRPGQRPTSSIEGECETCGLLKRGAGTPWAARRRDRELVRPSRQVTIPPIAESATPRFDVAFDALNHVGHGTLGTFERIAAQVEGSGLFADSFLRRQEVAGHIDVARDEWLRVTEWAINSATLVPVAAGRWVLIGARSRSTVERLRELHVNRAEVIESDDARTVRIEIVGELVDDVALAQAGVLALESSSAPTIAAALPTLGDVAAGLKAIAVPGYRTAERWVTAAASWAAADSLGKEGAYRLKGFDATYVVRSAEDIDAGRVRVGNAQLVKHIANLWAADPLMGYHTRSGSVVVPLGADLPGLYGRALSLCSGRAPREIEGQRMLQYPAVRRDVAEIIYDRLAK